MTTPLFRYPPSFDVLQPHVRELGSWLLVWANAQDRRLPSMEGASYLGACHSCPAGGSWEIEGDSISIEDGLALQGVSCLRCNATWRDVYVLAGFDQLETETPSTNGEPPDGLDRIDALPQGEPHEHGN